MSMAPVQPLGREQLADRAEGLIQALGVQFQQMGFAERPETHRAHDVHGFFQLSARPDLVLHVQVYPGMCDTRDAQLIARIMDKEQMQSQRDSEGASPGNEHGAVVHQLPKFNSIVAVPWDEVRLARELRGQIDSVVG